MTGTLQSAVRPRIGVLALQGAFAEHCVTLRCLGAEPFEIRALSDVKQNFNGLILPGGESTVQGKLLRELRLFDPLRAWIKKGLPVYGTCAGLILLARQIENSGCVHLGLMNITARRNAYGRQLGSFYTEADYDGKRIPMSFIRAPYIAAAGPGVKVLATVKGNIVAARQNNMLVTAFHPEVTEDRTVHQYFLDMVKQREKTVWYPIEQGPDDLKAHASRAYSETEANKQKPWL